MSELMMANVEDGTGFVPVQTRVMLIRSTPAAQRTGRRAGTRAFIFCMVLVVLSLSSCQRKLDMNDVIQANWIVDSFYLKNSNYDSCFVTNTAAFSKEYFYLPFFLYTCNTNRSSRPSSSYAVECVDSKYIMKIRSQWSELEGSYDIYFYLDSSKRTVSMILESKPDSSFIHFERIGADFNDWRRILSTLNPIPIITTTNPGLRSDVAYPK